MDAYFIPDTMQLSSLLKDFTSNRRQMAIVWTSTAAPKA